MTDPAKRGDELTQVVAAVIEQDGRYLLGRRPEGKRHGGMWEFPGGKLDEGESVLDGARRELDEELGLEVESVGDTLFVRGDVGAPFRIEFVRVTASGDPEIREHSEIGWFAPHEMVRLALAPADEAFAEWLTARDRVS